MASVFAFAGPQFGFNVGGEKTLQDGAGEILKWSTKKSNLSINLGVGIMAMSKLQAKINYNIAMGKTGEFEYSNAAGTVKDLVVGDAKANSWQVSVSYFF